MNQQIRELLTIAALLLFACAIMPTLPGHWRFASAVTAIMLGWLLLRKEPL
jgi:flagellar biosynthesis component FlhA